MNTSLTTDQSTQTEIAHNIFTFIATCDFSARTKGRAMASTDGCIPTHAGRPFP